MEPEEIILGEVGKETNPFIKSLENSVNIDDTTFCVSIYKFKVGKNGIFLEGIYYMGFIEILSKMGFYKRYENGSDNYSFVFICNNIMTPVTIDRIKTQFFDALHEYREDLTIDYRGFQLRVENAKLHEVWAKNHHLIFNNYFCEQLPVFNLPELRDTSDSAFFLFKNCVVRVDKLGITSLPYSKIERYAIWSSRIINRDFEYCDNTADNTHFHKFIYNVAGGIPERLDAFFTSIGYLLHSYNHPSMGQGVILYDERLSDLANPQGGTGKGLFAQGIRQVKELVRIDGKHFDESDKFKFQLVDQSTEVVFIDDLNPKTPFSTFFNVLTDGITIEKKNQKTLQISPHLSPKILFASNSVLGGDGKSDKRRQMILEFGDHYSRKIITGTEHPVEEEHGLMFGDDWMPVDWNRFFSFMLDCSHQYFIKGLLPYNLRNVAQNKLIQSLGRGFAEWFESKDLQAQTYKTEDLFEDYKVTYGIGDEFKQRSFTNSLVSACEVMGWRCKITRSNGASLITFSR